ncbi:MAG TPA: phosphomannomutase/phosphoglucomutase [Nocardioidaceae bacterium]|nr:phosphomannomutase/phosphoglucomutase [Nocardioidaceae bacterium]
MRASGWRPNPEVLDAVFKAYDVRGLVPDQLDEPLAEAVGAAFARHTGAAAVVVGHDMRSSSPGLAEAFTAGVTGAGADVVAIGLASTDELYYASGVLDAPGAMFTASHNPAVYNGIKLCRAGAVPVGTDSGLADIRALVAGERRSPASSPAADRPAADRPTAGRGAVRTADLLADYADHLHTLAPVRGRRLTVVVDAGNGMAGLTAPAVLGSLDLDLTVLYGELDGSFPNHEANPIDPENLRDLCARVRELGADVGLAFDGDADRCFLVDERGRPVDPSLLTALIAVRELAKEPGATVIHNLITSRAVPQVIVEHGGVPVRTRVGHSYIKATMATTDAIFGGEHSGHFYFRDFWRADSGMLAALHALGALAETDQPLSELLARYSRYVASGEINSTVADQQAVLAALEREWAGDGVDVDHLDGLTVTAADWWFNVRASNTEPLLRLNAEAKDEATMARVRDAVLATIRRRP